MSLDLRDFTAHLLRSYAGSSGNLLTDCYTHLQVQSGEQFSDEFKRRHEVKYEGAQKSEGGLRARVTSPGPGPVFGDHL